MSKGAPLASIMFLGLVNLLICILFSFATSRLIIQKVAPVSNKKDSQALLDLKLVSLEMYPSTVFSEYLASLIFSIMFITSFSG